MLLLKSPSILASMKYNKAILGGTFDHFHKGHEALLTRAFEKSQQITIGLTTEKFYQNKLLAETIEEYSLRKRTLEQFLRKEKYTNRATIMQLTDIYGPALSEKTIDAIFVTKDTLAGANIINIERKKINFPALHIELVPLATAQDNTPITSERIRLGEMDANGYLYRNVFPKKSRLHLPESLKTTLRQPIGEVCTTDNDLQSVVQDAPLIITVGDIVTLLLQKLSSIPQLNIIDLKTRRENLQESQKNRLLATTYVPLLNPAGEINTHIATMLPKYIKQILRTQVSQTILVKGEEDLLTLPAILLAPLNSLVIYGQHDLGAIVVRVTKEKKEFCYNLLKQFN